MDRRGDGKTGGVGDAGDGRHLIVVISEVLRQLPGVRHLALPLIVVVPGKGAT